MHVKKMSSSRDIVPAKKESYWELLIFLFKGGQKTLAVYEVDSIWEWREHNISWGDQKINYTAKWIHEWIIIIKENTKHYI